MERLAPHDEACSLRPGAEVEPVGELANPGAFERLAVLADRRLPAVLVILDGHDRRMNAGRLAGHDREADVALAASGHEPMTGAGRVSPHHHRPTHESSVVTHVVAGGDLGGQLGNCRVEHGQMIGDTVGGRVARTQQGSQRLPGRVRETQHWMEPEAVLVVRRGPFLVLGMDLHQRGVDVEHHRCRSRRRSRPTPNLGPTLADRLPQSSERVFIDAAERAIQRRVRRNLTKQLRLGPQVLDVSAGLATAGQHQHGLH